MEDNQIYLIKSGVDSFVEVTGTKLFSKDGNFGFHNSDPSMDVEISGDLNVVGEIYRSGYKIDKNSQSFTTSILSGQKNYEIFFPAEFEEAPAIAVTLEIEDSSPIIPYVVSGVSKNSYHINFASTVPSNTYRLNTLFGGRGSFSGYHLNPIDALPPNFGGKWDQDADDIYFTGGKVAIGKENPSVALDIQGDASISSDLNVGGNLTISGSTTTVHSTTITVDDKNLELGSSPTPTDAGADGGGIILKGTTDKTMLWNTTANKWNFNKGLEVLDSSNVVTGGDDPVAIRIGHSNQDGGNNTYNTAKDVCQLQFYSADTSGGNNMVRGTIGMRMEGVAGGASSLTLGTHGQERMTILSNGTIETKAGFGTAGQRALRQTSLTLKSEYAGGDGKPYTGFGGGIEFRNEGYGNNLAPDSNGRNPGDVDYVTTYSKVFLPSAQIHGLIGDQSNFQHGGHISFSVQESVDLIDDINEVSPGGVNYLLTYASSENQPQPVEKVRITHDGNVGIGTADPGGTLELSSTSTDTNLYMGGTPAVGTREPWRVQSEGDFLHIGQAKSAFAKYMTFKGSNVGIGTTNPGSALSIYHDSGDTLILEKSTTEPSVRFKGDLLANKDFVLTMSGTSFKICKNDGATSLLEIQQDETVNISGSSLRIDGYTGIGETYSARSTIIGNNIYVKPSDAVSRQVRTRMTHASYGHSYIEMHHGKIEFFAKREAVIAENVVNKNLLMTVGGDAVVGIGTSASATANEPLSIGNSTTQNAPYIALSRDPTGGYWAGIRFYQGALATSTINEDADGNIILRTNGITAGELKHSLSVSPNHDVYIGLRDSTVTADNKLYYIKSAPYKWTEGVGFSTDIAAIGMGSDSPGSDDGIITFNTAINVNTGGTLVERARFTSDGILKLSAGQILDYDSNYIVAKKTPSSTNFITNSTLVDDGNGVSPGNNGYIVTYQSYSGSRPFTFIGSPSRLNGGALGVVDRRIPRASDFPTGALSFAFSSYSGGSPKLVNDPNGNSPGDAGYVETFSGPWWSYPYADCLVLNSYTDSSGGSTNAMIFSKSSNLVKLCKTGFDNHTLFSAGSVSSFDLTGASDQSVKENVNEIDQALQKINSLRPVTFEWTDEYIDSGLSKNDAENIFNEDGERVMPEEKVTNVGLIAQEVEEVIPTVVHNNRVSLSGTEDGLKDIDYEKLIPHMIKAIQELKEKIEQLENK